MYHCYDGYHMTWASEIEAGDTGSRELHEELAYDLPWRVLAVFVAAVVAIGGALTLLIELLR